MLKKILSLFSMNNSAVPTGPAFERLEDRVLLSATLGVEKEIIATSETETTGNDVVIGEEVTYQITANLPEGVTNTVTLTDFLPDNMEYIAGTLSVTPNGPITTNYIDEATSATYDPIANELLINFGTVINVFDSDPSNDFIIISFDAVVVNDLVNQDGDVLTNQVTLTDGVTSVSDSVDVNVVEPELDIDKDISSGSTTVQIGDTVDYTIEVSHGTTSTASAFDLNLQDVIPSQIQGVTLISAYIIEAGLPDVDVMGSFSIDVNGNLTTTGDIDLLLSGASGGSQSLVIRLQGTAASDSPSSIVNNTAEVTWSSINGPSAGERDGSGGVNDYNDSDPASITVTRPITPPVVPPPILPPPGSPPGGGPPISVIVPPSNPVFSFDAIRNDAIEEDIGDIFDYEIPDLDYVLPGVPVAPLYTGTALPGATLVVSLTDVDGNMLAENSVVVGPDGNWLISFPAAYIEDYPYGIEIEHEFLLRTQVGDAKLDDLSLQYNPAANVISLFKYSLNTEWVYHRTASKSLEIMHSFVSRPIL